MPPRRRRAEAPPRRWPYLLLGCAVFGVAQALTFGLRSARIGLYLRALRAAPSAARSVGVAPLPPRLAVLAASAFVTSVAGSFFAQYTLAVSPHLVFGLPLAFDIALLGVVAGSISPWGALPAGLVYALATKAVAFHPPGTAGAAVLAAEGAIIVLVTLLRPPGVFGSRRRGVPVGMARTAG